MEFITTNDSLKPVGHYSQAIRHGDLIFVSGQLAIDHETGEQSKGTAAEETARVLNNLQRILVAGKSDKSQVIRCTLYLADIADWGAINAVYAKFFDEHKPARAVVPTSTLPFDFKVEVDAIAAVSTG